MSHYEKIIDYEKRLFSEPIIDKTSITINPRKSSSTIDKPEEPVFIESNNIDDIVNEDIDDEIDDITPTYKSSNNITIFDSDNDSDDGDYSFHKFNKDSDEVDNLCDSLNETFNMEESVIRTEGFDDDEDINEEFEDNDDDDDGFENDY